MFLNVATFLSQSGFLFQVQLHLPHVSVSIIIIILNFTLWLISYFNFCPLLIHYSLSVFFFDLFLSYMRQLMLHHLYDKNLLL